MYDYYGTHCSSLQRSGISKSKTRSNSSRIGYGTLVNLLDYSAAVLPVTLADKTIDVVDKDYKPLNGQDAKVYAGCEFSVVSILLP